MPTDYAQEVAQLRLESERRLAVIVTSLTFIPNIAFVYVDRAIVANAATVALIWMLRAAQVALWLVGLRLLLHARSRERLRSVLFGLALALVVFILWIAWLRPPTNFMPLRTFFIMSFGIFVAYPYPFRQQLITWIVLAAGTAALVFGRYATMTPVDRYSVAANFLLAGGLGMIVSRSRWALDRDLDVSMERERAAIAAREVAAADLRRLEGIIPICSYCHQVRTEAGAWEALDLYVRSRTDADFSHGVCPSCAQLHYGTLMDKPTGAPPQPPSPGD